MPTQEIKDLLQKLHQSLASVDDLDPETTKLLRDLDSDIQRVLENDEQPIEETGRTLVDQARDLESQFAATHPVAEQFLRELIDALGRFGV